MGTIRISREIAVSRGGPGGRRRHDRAGVARGCLMAWAWEIATFIDDLASSSWHLAVLDRSETTKRFVRNGSGVFLKFSRNVIKNH